MANHICHECFGTGIVVYEVNAGYSTEFGEYVAGWVEETCPLCGGTGEYDEDFEALLMMSTPELEAYAGEAWDASPQ